MEIHQRENEDKQVQSASVFSVRPELGYLPRVRIRSRRSYPCIELIRAVLGMTKKQIKLNQATEAAGEIKSVLQV